jgi:thymidylate synthase
MITIIQGRNVNHTFVKSLNVIRTVGEKQDSRNGKVIVAPTPVVTCTDNPQERVLFNAERDANPFFHFFECLWMLSGSSDGRWLDQFVRDFSARYAEDDGNIHGAYGDRWRNWPNVGDGTAEALYWGAFCQLEKIIEILKKNKFDRRAVISMWDPVRDLDTPVRDAPCNTHIYPRIVGDSLDITVCCRSNDIIWGATGANAVHFSFLQEYLAARIGVAVGKMYQLSNNWHAYTSVLDKIPRDVAVDDRYTTGAVSAHPICDVPEQWDKDLHMFMDVPIGAKHRWYRNKFFRGVAVPMLETHRLWRAGRRDAALISANNIEASDWGCSTMEWMSRRMK